jgi:hypothetical protein
MAALEWERHALVAANEEGDKDRQADSAFISE